MCATAAQATGTGLGRVGQIAIAVADLDGAVAFYRDALGLPLLFQAPPGLAFFDCAGLRLMLAGAEDGEPPRGNSVLYFVVADLPAAHAALAARGVPFVDEPHLVARMPDHDLWMCFLRDPEQNLIGLMSEVPRAE